MANALDVGATVGSVAAPPASAGFGERVACVSVGAGEVVASVGGVVCASVGVCVTLGSGAGVGGVTVGDGPGAVEGCGLHGTGVDVGFRSSRVLIIGRILPLHEFPIPVPRD